MNLILMIINNRMNIIKKNFKSMPMTIFTKTILLILKILVMTYLFLIKNMKKQVKS